MKKKLSVAIITLNEEKIIDKCLDKLLWADEIVIIDSGSTDNTVEICQKKGAQVYFNKFEGYGEQKQFAVSKTSNNWVLSLDADEILTEALIDEIKKIDFDSTELSAFNIRRKHVFLKKVFNHGYESNRKFLRLFDKQKGNFNTNKVHESVSVSGKVGSLKNAFIHYSYESLEDYIFKLNKYTTLYAKTKKEKNKSYSLIEIILKSKFEFLKKYILELNFLNGKEGFLWAYFSMVYTFTKCVKTNE